MTQTIDYGIDLGTTNSCVAKLEAGALRVFQNNDHMNVTPSAVHILKTGRMIVGRRGYSALLTDPENVAVEFKRWMGQRDRKRFPAAQREFSAEELSAEVLKALKEDVRRQSGFDVTAAVITVPAAFGALQCDATARAAALAGINEAPLLQEPIAAALAYGARPGTADQRWLVFDLGGGTLDIAVISTRDGRLNVLEHRGDNLLGGKDIDRLIVDRVLLPAIQSTYDLADSTPNAARRSLLPRLRTKAEEAKIDLSTDLRVIISLLDLGADDSGQPIDLEVPFSRAQLEALMEPMLEKCCALAADALAAARLKGADLDRILLVGGPTQTPMLRSMLQTRLGAPVDFSADPMTVVGRGAAIYASTTQRATDDTGASRSTSSPRPADVNLRLAYEPVSSDLECVVAGRVSNPAQEVEIKFEAQGGHWTSGWINPRGGLFECVVSLKEGDLTTFWIYARDARGNLLETDVSEFKIRHGLVLSATPLPHTVSIEVLKVGGKSILDPIFRKGTPLPAEKTVKYRATHALVPNNPASNLAIKLWEGEFLEDPDANEWVGNVMLTHDGVRRSIPEGAEIEVTMKIDASRLTSIEAFVPHLNQHFSNSIYVAQREEQDFSNLSRAVASETQALRDRVDQIERNSAGIDDEQTKEELNLVRREVDELTSKASTRGRTSAKSDPDDDRRIVEDSKRLRGRLGQLERRTVGERASLDSNKLLGTVEIAQEVVEKFGSSLEKQQLALLLRELQRTSNRSDDKQVQRICQELDSLRWRVLFKQDWFLREIFESLRQPGTPFLDPAAARSLFAKGQSAVASGDGEGLKTVVLALWKLQPQSSADKARDSAMRSGLRAY